MSRRVRPALRLCAAHGARDVRGELLRCHAEFLGKLERVHKHLRDSHPESLRVHLSTVVGRLGFSGNPSHGLVHVQHAVPNGKQQLLVRGEVVEAGIVFLGEGVAFPDKRHQGSQIGRWVGHGSLLCFFAEPSTLSNPVQAD